MEQFANFCHLLSLDGFWRNHEARNSRGRRYHAKREIDRAHTIQARYQGIDHAELCRRSAASH